MPTNLLLLPLVLLSALPISFAQSQWGTLCTYTGQKLSASITLSVGDQVLVTKIPANKKKVFVQLNAAGTADLDMRLVDSKGVPMIQYSDLATYNSASPTNQKNWCCYGNTVYTTAVSFSYNGMKITACMDKCQATMTTPPYFDGHVENLVGTVSFGEEWLYIDQTLEELSLYTVAFTAGSGYISWSAD